MDEVGIVGCAICCIMCVHSLQGDENTIEMCPTSSVAVCIIQLYDCMIANKDPHHTNLTFINTLGEFCLSGFNDNAFHEN